MSRENAKFGIIALMFIVCLACAPTFGTTYHGSLSWSHNAGDTGLYAEGEWAACGTSIAWWVTDIADGWHYEYRITVADDPSISHVIFEATPEVFSLTNASGEVEIKVHDPSADNKKPNPYLPESIYGPKFELDDDDLFITITFDSPNQPVWRDWYAVGGNPKNWWNFGAVWNRGFLLDDPTVAASDGSIDWHILGEKKVSGTFCL